VIYAPIDQTIFHTMLSGADPNPFPLMASGFSILPNISEDTLGGTLLTMVFQISVKAITSKQAVDLATDVIRNTLKKIKVAVP
jgi:hypothetical protein